MRLLPSHKKILDYLNKHGSANTFRLSRYLKIDRTKLIALIEELANESLVNFRSGTVAKSDKESAQKTTKSKKKRAKKVSTSKIRKKSRVLKREYFKLKKPKGKIKRLKDEIEDLQNQRGIITQKIAKERALLRQIRKEKKETEKNLVEWEKSLSQREEDIQKKEKSVSAAEKRLKREKQRIVRARVLKKDINKLEATLEDLEKKVSIEREKSKQPKEKKAKPKAVSKRIKKPKRKEQIQKKEKYKLEKREEPKLEEQGYKKIRLEEEKIKDTSISGFENVLEAKPPEHLEPAISESPRHELEKASFPSLRSDDFEEPEEIKPTLKSKIKEIIAKIRVSKTETEKPEIMPEELWQPATRISEENIEGRFHDLIEREISLLKQRRIDEARNIHLQIKDMISGVTDPYQRKIIVKDWNRVKDFY